MTDIRITATPDDHVMSVTITHDGHGRSYVLTGDPALQGNVRIKRVDGGLVKVDDVDLLQALWRMVKP